MHKCKCKLAQSYMTFLMCMEKYIQQIHFHLPLFTLTLFHTSQKPPQVSVNFFLRKLRDFFFFLAFPSLVSDAILQNVHTNEEMETACEDVTADLWVDDFTCLMWSRLMSLTTSVVTFSHLWATTFFKTIKSFKNPKGLLRIYFHRRIKHEIS